jgi:hypothetical protein
MPQVPVSRLTAEVGLMGKPVTIAGLIAAILSFAWLSPGRAERVVLDRPVNLVVTLENQTRLRGRMTAWDAQGFNLTDGDDHVHDVAWSRLPAAQVYQIHEGLLRSADGAAWLDLGVRLREMDGGEAQAERAFVRAERLDASLKTKTERARKGEPLDDPAPPATLTDGILPPGAGGDPGGMAAGPRMVGGVQHDNWGPQSPEKTEASIARLKAFGEETRQKINSNLQLYETDFFICYTDLSPQESRRWAGELDKMYNRLCDLFDVQRGENIWLGKCLIFIFRSEPDYHRFQSVMHQTDSTGTAGMCHGYGHGDVHVAFFRQSNEMLFAHILVHESVHGFLHRYRSPVHIPTWINEGLAEVISYELVPKATSVPTLQALGRTQVRMLGHTGRMFDAPRLERWQYGLASSLTTFMIQQNKRGYVAFINGIKDGQTWRDSLEKNYGVGLDRLVQVFGETQGVRNLRP